MTQLDHTPLGLLVADLGQSWVDDVRAKLKSDGRRPTGMWPGRLSEARALVIQAIRESPGSRFDDADCERIARELYAAARRRWLVHAERASDDDVD